MILTPAKRSGTLISGRSMPAASSRSSTRSSSVLRVGADPSAITAFSAPVPGCPLERAMHASICGTLTRCRACARRAALRSALGASTVARSSRVRAGRGDGDPVVSHDVSPMQRAGAMDPQPSDAPGARADDGDLDESLLPAHEVEVRGSSEPAEVRDLAGGEDCGHEARVEREPGVAHGVHASEHRMQAAVADSPAYRIRVEPARAKLARIDLPFLLRGPLRDQHIGGCVVLVAYSATWTTHPLGHEGIVARFVLRN